LRKLFDERIEQRDLIFVARPRRNLHRHGSAFGTRRTSCKSLSGSEGDAERTEHFYDFFHNASILIEFTKQTSIHCAQPTHF